MLDRLRSFLRHRGGNFAMLTALSLIPILGGVGLAVDYARASHARTLLYGAADAAASGAVSKASRTFQEGGFSADWGLQQAQADAINMFKTNVVDNVGFTISDVTADVQENGRKLTATVNFTAQVPMTFMNFFGQQEVQIKGDATAMVELAPFMDFYLVLDNSPSMGLGATPGDISTLESHTPDTCAFACHTTAEPKNNYYDIAKQYGVTMRIDVVREAAQNLFDKAEEMRVHNDQFRMATYTFGAAAESAGLAKVADLSSDLARGKSSVGSVDLMTIPSQGYNNDQQTPLDDVFSDINKQIGIAGAGNGPNDREKVVFFVSDGVADQPKSACTEPPSGLRCHEPIDPTICRQMKQRGITVAVLYTTYQPVEANGYYRQWIKPFQPDIAAKMSDCATPGFFFEVSPSDGIVEAMQTLFLKVISTPRITG